MCGDRTYMGSLCTSLSSYIPKTALKKVLKIKGKGPSQTTTLF